MTLRQRRLMVAAVGAGALMLLVPPWASPPYEYKTGSTHNDSVTVVSVPAEFVSFSPILFPPTYEARESVGRERFPGRFTPPWIYYEVSKQARNARIAWGILSTQFAALAVVTVVGLLLLRERQ